MFFPSVYEHCWPGHGQAVYKDTCGCSLGSGSAGPAAGPAAGAAGGSTGATGPAGGEFAGNCWGGVWKIIGNPYGGNWGGKDWGENGIVQQIYKGFKLLCVVRQDEICLIESN